MGTKIFNVDLVGDGPNAPVMAVPDVVVSPSTKFTLPAKDPSTGFFVEQITDGCIKVGDLGDTRAFPQSGIVITQVPPQDKYGGV